jgi:hypothetical protein
VAGLWDVEVCRVFHIAFFRLKCFIWYALPSQYYKFIWDSPIQKSASNYTQRTMPYGLTNKKTKRNHHFKTIAFGFH